MAVGLLKGLASTVGAGIRMALFLRVREESIHASPGGELAIILLAILARLGSDFFLVGFAGEWTLDGMPDMLFPVALALMFAAIAAEVSDCQQDLVLIVIVLLSIGFSIQLFAGVLAYLLEFTGRKHHRHHGGRAG